MKQNYLIYGHALLIGDTVCHKIYTGEWGRIQAYERFYPAEDTYVYCQSTEEYVSINDAFWNSYYKRWFYIDENTIKVDTPEGSIPQEWGENNGYTYANDYDGMVHEDDIWYCELSEEYYYEEDQQVRTYCGTIAHYDALDDSDWRYCDRGHAEGQWVHYDDVAYCEDIDEYVHIDDAFYSESDGCYYYEEENAREPEPDVIAGYHNSPNARRITKYSDMTMVSNYWIGFEIEKNYFVVDDEQHRYQGDVVGECDLFKGYETDSSCGVEAVTNILPLGTDRNRFEVFSMMENPIARQVINSPTSSSCGGHINISSDNHSPAELYDRMRPYMGILYALFRYRLKNSYCVGNPKVDRYNNQKYSPVYLRSTHVEIRIPNRVISVEQLKRRYDLMYLIVHSASLALPFDEVLERAKPIIAKMYGGNAERVQLALDLAYDFRDYIENDLISTKIQDYVRDTD